MQLAVGEITIDRVVESQGPLFEPGFFMPDFEPEVLEANKDWLLPRFVDPQSGKLVLAIQSYILRTGRHTILVDACVGNDKPRPQRPFWDRRQWPYLEDLGKLGVQPEGVDFVMCTHLHIDHVGWNTRLKNGRWVPTFPNARYVFARTEYELWEDRYNTGFEGPVPNVFDDSVLPVMEAGQAELVASDYQFDDSLWFEPAPGHTAGNIVVNLASNGSAAVLSGDVVHHPIQLVRPDWSSRACDDPAQSAATRRALLERLADTDTLLAPAHFPPPSIGHVVSRGDAFGYRLAGA